MEEKEEEEERRMKLIKAVEGARELIRMIDSLSNSPNLDVRAKRVARDLLEGARDLQSSLAVLTRHEAGRPNRFALRESRRNGFSTKEEVGFDARVVIKKSRFSLDEFSRNGRASAFKLEQISEYEKVESRLSAERVEELRRVIADGVSHSAVASKPKQKTLGEIIGAKFDTLQLHKHGGGFKNKDDTPPIVIMEPNHQASKNSIRPAAIRVGKSADTETDEKRKSPEAGKDSRPKNSRTSNDRDSERMQSELEQDLTCLLLSSRSFVNDAKELFRIDSRPPVYCRKVIGEEVMKNPKLYLDCGKELMVRRSLAESNAGTNPMSLPQLAEEISRAIEGLTGYGNADGNASWEDDMCLRLERDVKCREVMASANWDVGWVNWICNEELNVVVADLEEFIVSWLITDLVQDLL